MNSTAAPASARANERRRVGFEIKWERHKAADRAAAVERKQRGMAWIPGVEGRASSRNHTQRCMLRSTAAIACCYEGKGRPSGKAAARHARCAGVDSLHPLRFATVRFWPEADLEEGWLTTLTGQSPVETGGSSVRAQHTRTALVPE